ncbi:MAG: hypothetical protein RL596_879 [Bacteroidota bacterium]
MSDSNDIDDEFIVEDIVDNAIIADAYAVGITAFEFFVTDWSRVLCELTDSKFNIGVKRFINFLQIFECWSAKLEGVEH